MTDFLTLLEEAMRVPPPPPPPEPDEDDEVESLYEEGEDEYDSDDDDDEDEEEETVEVVVDLAAPAAVDSTGLTIATAPPTVLITPVEAPLPKWFGAAPKPFYGNKDAVPMPITAPPAEMPLPEPSMQLDAETKEALALITLNKAKAFLASITPPAPETPE